MKQPSPLLRHRQAWTLVGLLLSLACWGDAANSIKERKTITSFLLNFPKFVEWPKQSFSSPESPYIICVMGIDPLGTTLDAKLARKRTKGRRFEARRLPIDDVEQARLCHILFIGSPQPQKIQDITRQLSQLPILTVGESSAFAANGGMIGLVPKGKRMALTINRTRLDAAPLEVEERLLKVSTHY